MINKPAKCAPALREKKLAKKLKNCVKELFEKLFILLMEQEVCGIIIQDILESLLSVYKMMF